MISNYIKSSFKAGLLLSTLAVLSACSSSSSSSSDDATSVEIAVAPLAANTVTVSSDTKEFTALSTGTIIVLEKAYLVFSSVTIETDCDVTFTKVIDGLFNIIIPVAHAHTEATPTSTGAPYVIDLLGVDGTDTELGELSPPTGDYCGAEIDFQAADSDAANLPAGADDPDMIGKTLYIEGTYDTGTGAVDFDFSTSINLSRKLALSTLMVIDSDDPDGEVEMVINYDTWFDNIDMFDFASGVSLEVSDVLTNITESIRQR
jgi:hypothetical protein